MLLQHPLNPFFEPVLEVEIVNIRRNCLGNRLKVFALA
jgi:hypothetical protein